MNDEERFQEHLRRGMKIAELRGLSEWFTENLSVAFWSDERREKQLEWAREALEKINKLFAELSVPPEPAVPVEDSTVNSGAAPKEPDPHCPACSGTGTRLLADQGDGEGQIPMICDCTWPGTFTPKPKED